jgi:hypothetical protein
LSAQGAPGSISSLSASDASRGDRFGYSIATDGARIIAGSPQNQKGLNRAFGIENGAFEIFELSPGLPLSRPNLSATGMSTPSRKVPSSDESFAQRVWMPGHGRFTSPAAGSFSTGVQNSPLKAFPNPSSALVELAFEDGRSLENASWTLSTVLGHRAASGRGSTLDLESCTPGVYLLSLNTSDRVYSIRLIRKP